MKTFICQVCKNVNIFKTVIMNLTTWNKGTMHKCMMDHHDILQIIFFVNVISNSILCFSPESLFFLPAQAVLYLQSCTDFFQVSHLGVGFVCCSLFQCSPWLNKSSLSPHLVAVPFHYNIWSHEFGAKLWRTTTVVWLSLTHTTWCFLQINVSRKWRN